MTHSKNLLTDVQSSVFSSLDSIFRGFNNPSILHQNSKTWERRRLESFYTWKH